MTRRAVPALSLVCLIPLAACTWDDEGPRIRSACRAEFERCREACDDIVAGRRDVELDPVLNDPLTCEPRCFNRFQRCLDETKPSEDEAEQD